MALKGSQLSLRGRKHFDGRLPMGVWDFVYCGLESSEHSKSGVGEMATVGSRGGTLALYSDTTHIPLRIQSLMRPR